ncbi:MAG: hypothetical protein K9N06_01085 [Candidatus Cloacimonetes bacterium]|nr:hypothetical protein [Candidatus Cloacimonadota bacterium]
MNKIIILIVLLCCLADVNSNQVIEWAVDKPDSLASIIDPAYRNYCNRLETCYVAFPDKSLIGYGFTQAERNVISRARTALSISETETGKATLITLQHPGIKRPVHFALQDGMLISPYQLQTQDWTQYQGKFIEYRVQDNSKYQPEQLVILDAYCAHLAELLKISPQRLTLLQNQKIRYYRCESPDEIARITGYQCRGMGILAEDAVISSFPCHFHEISHIMINYALQDILLYTHPFLQEGFAVATGGRGGKSANVLLDIAAFLGKEGFIEPTDLQDVNFFHAQDASITYPVAGLYNTFLLSAMNAEEYLTLYRFYSNDTGIFGTIYAGDLPPQPAWTAFLQSASFSAIETALPAEKFVLLHQSPIMTIRESVHYYEITASDSACFNYFTTSIQPDENGRFCITLQNGEVNILDNITANLVASYAEGLSSSSIPLKTQNNQAVFYLQKVKAATFNTGF